MPRVMLVIRIVPTGTAIPINIGTVKSDAKSLIVLRGTSSQGDTKFVVADNSVAAFGDLKPQLDSSQDLSRRSEAPFAA